MRISRRQAMGILAGGVVAGPESRQALNKSRATGAPQTAGAKVTAISLLGHNGPLPSTQNEQGLSVTLPEKPPCEYAVALKI
jgi:hypothetical protein